MWERFQTLPEGPRAGRKDSRIRQSDQTVHCATMPTLSHIAPGTASPTRTLSTCQTQHPVFNRQRAPGDGTPLAIKNSCDPKANLQTNNCCEHAHPMCELLRARNMRCNHTWSPIRTMMRLVVRKCILHTQQSPREMTRTQNIVEVGKHTKPSVCICGCVDDRDHINQNCNFPIHNSGHEPGSSGPGFLGFPRVS